jgi:hypothetical protein
MFLATQSNGVQETEQVRTDGQASTADTIGTAFGLNITNVLSGGTPSLLSVDLRRGEPNADYHADQTYRSCSTIKTFLDSPLLYHQRYIAKTLPPFSSPAMSHGTMLHSWLEHGDDFLESLVVPPTERLTATGLLGKDAEKWAENEAPPGSTLISPKEKAQLLAEVAAIRRHPACVEMLDQIVDREASVRWVSPDGHYLKCRYDARTPDFWIDLKTTSEQDILAGFWSPVLKYRYHLQDAWYRCGMEACGLEPAPLRFIVVSTSLPHDCQVVTLPDAIVAEGRRLMDRALADLRVREDLDWWLPDTHGEVVELSFPAHVMGRIS